MKVYVESLPRASYSGKANHVFRVCGPSTILSSSYDYFTETLIREPISTSEKHAALYNQRRSFVPVMQRVKDYFPWESR